MKFEWEWCPVCEAWYILCPKCGNNTCNGTCGEIDGEMCDVCELAYQYQSLAYKHDDVPSSEGMPKFKWEDL
jgi:hypothetical protein